MLQEQHAQDALQVSQNNRELKESSLSDITITKEKFALCLFIDIL